MKNILFIHHATGWGGAPKSMIATIKSLNKEKYRASVLLLKKSVVCNYLETEKIPYSIAKSAFYKKYYHFFTHSEAGYVKWYQLYSFIRLSLLWLLSRYYFAKRELRTQDFDIAHLNSSVLTDWLAPAKKKGKVVIHIREPFRNGKFDMLRPFFRRQMRIYADKIIAISKDNADRVDLPEKTSVIYNYAVVPLTEPPTESYSSKKFLYLGGSASIKGFYTTVEALDYLQDGVKIVFGGDFSIVKKKRGLIKKSLRWVLQYGVKQKAAILKLQKHPRAEILGLTNNVDKYLDEVCCLLSPFSAPHFSRPVIEAYLHKKPAIGSDVKGMDEIIEHQKTGLIFPTDNKKELASAINFIANNSIKAKEWGESGYRIAKQTFSPENIRQFEKYYNQLLHIN